MKRSAIQRKPAPRKPLKPRRCKAPGCGETFVPQNSMTKACSVPCALALSRQQRERDERRSEKRAAMERRRQQAEDRERVKTRSELMREAQQAFNAWIRARDYGLPCISCGRYHEGQHHASHYRSVGSNPALRFEPDNCHRSCAPCNTHLSGNLIGYRKGLIEKIGEDRVEWLEGPHKPKKYSADDLRAMKKEFRRREREERRRP